MEETQVEKLMRLLDISEEEAQAVLKSDEEIDKGAKHFELSPEQKKAEKKMRGVARAVNTYGKAVQREKAIDADKRKLIDLITETLENITDNGEVEVTNPERELNFKLNGRKFKIVLSAPRK